MRRRTSPWSCSRGLLAAALAVAALTGCGSGDGGDAGGAGDAAPAAAGDLVSQGEQLYDANCAACHGAELDGTRTGPPLRHIVYEPSHHPDEAFQRAVAEGVTPHHWDFGPMPPIAGLDEDEVEAIVAYVRHRQETDGFIE